MKKNLSVFALTNVAVNQVVFWADPDNDISSGLYIVNLVNSVDGVVEPDTVVMLSGVDDERAEAPLSELYAPEALAVHRDGKEMLHALGTLLERTLACLQKAADEHRLDGMLEMDLEDVRALAKGALQAREAFTASVAADVENRILADIVLDGVYRAALVEKHWCDRELQFAVQGLTGWLTTTKFGVKDFSSPVGKVLLGGVEAAQSVADAWGSTNMVDAVGKLITWHEGAADALAELNLLPQTAAVVVEVSGGVCTDVSSRGDVAVIVLDYDNGADDPSYYPAIPGRKSAHASINKWDGDLKNPAFVTNVEIKDAAHNA